MKIEKQLMVLGLLRERKYRADPLTGDVISLIGKQPRIMNAFVNEHGYKQIQLDMGHEEGRIFLYQHQFIYLAAYGTFDPDLVIDHINRDRGDNRLANLRTATQAENLANNGKSSAFINRNAAGQRRRVQADERAAIKALHKEGLTYVQIANKMQVSRQTVSIVVNE